MLERRSSSSLFRTMVIISGTPPYVPARDSFNRVKLTEKAFTLDSNSLGEMLLCPFKVKINESIENFRKEKKKNEWAAWKPSMNFCEAVWCCACRASSELERSIWLTVHLPDVCSKCFSNGWTKKNETTFNFNYIKYECLLLKQ